MNGEISNKNEYDFILKTEKSFLWK